MSDPFDFAPDPDRASFLDARMQAGLGHSLEHILERAGTLEGLNTSGISAVAEAIENGTQYGPVAFGRYYELIFALLGERYDDAVAASAFFSDLKPVDGRLHIDPLDDAVMGEDAALIRRRIGPEAERRYLPPPKALVEPFREQLESALAQADRLLPELAGEIRHLVRHIVMASTPDDDEFHFSGSSAYMLWGLMVLNPRFIEEPIETLEILAHEAAHMLLFGLTFDEALVLNEDADRFGSPIRRDPRPMDGVYHATFVLARVHWAMSRMAACRDLDSASRDEAATAAARCLDAFGGGLATVETYAQLSETGAAVLASTKEYMSAAA